MRVARHAVAERALERDVARRVVEVLLAAQHVRDAHPLVVHHHAQVIGREAVALQDHEVVGEVGGEGDLAEDLVAHDQRLVRPAEADHVRLVRRARERRRAVEARGPHVAERARLGLRAPPQRLELLGRLEGGVGEVLRDEGVQRRAVEPEALRLEEGPDAARVAADAVVLRPLVPVDAEPGEVFEDAGHRGVGGAQHVRVFDAQQEAPAEPACQGPVEQRRARAAHVQVAGGRGREA